MKKIKVMVVFGTRPEAIKMSPIVLELQKQLDSFEPIVVVSAQHREMLDQVLEIFKITPDYDLNIMSQNQTLSEITQKILAKMEEILEQEQPDIVLVHGDTTTAFSTALSSFYHKIPIGHVEAGLRTWDKYSPFPEEMNRQMIDTLSDLHFAPTVTSKENLLCENHTKNIYVTGNTAIDALNWTVRQDFHHDLLEKIDSENKIILMTMHRRENLGQPMRDVFEAIVKIVEEEPTVEIVFPVHLNPKIRQLANEIFGGCSRIHLIEPLDVIDFHNFASKSYLILTDSGGIQEEAPSLDIPVLVLRDTTERMEGIEAGALLLVGTDKEMVYQQIKELLQNKESYNKLASATNPYGDGTASKQILSIIKEYFSAL
ncbi:MAG: UDP-N-acetylglucosamine 2-epimerase (non-hydrolyzing) [Lactobacillales bacterium]|jgi:UDP-N-acetylglucosamine 2-epimerase (non-hydrolysing)|nr:UDP-N-acetylglucosamine 2-epimerase (non-hydrolyzing) [Lactobacillales bacterium]